MNGFEVMHKKGNNVVILHLKGFLDAHTAPTLESAIQKCLDEKSFNVVVNFFELNYISSAGLGVFMGFIEEIRREGGDIKLSTMSPKIYRVFDLLGFPALYEIFDTDEAAISQFANKS